jgi:hypothetical protein
VGYTALELANLAYLHVRRVPERGLARREGPYLIIGPRAHCDAIATIACKRIVELRGEACTAKAVRAEVEKHGFKYLPEQAARLRKADGPLQRNLRFA